MFQKKVEDLWKEYSKDLPEPKPNGNGEKPKAVEEEQEKPSDLPDSGQKGKDPA